MKNLSFLNNAWYLHITFDSAIRPFYASGLAENGGRWWWLRLWGMDINISSRNLHERHLMAIMGMMAHGEGKKWKSSAKELSHRNWSFQEWYSQMAQIRREIRSTRRRITRLTDEEEIEREKYFIELRLDTLHEFSNYSTFERW